MVGVDLTKRHPNPKALMAGISLHRGTGFPGCCKSPRVQAVQRFLFNRCAVVVSRKQNKKSIPVIFFIRLFSSV